METIRLKQFCALVETNNLRKAAELLKISHSGLSKSMRTLENEIGVKLFLPHGRGIVISDEGKKFYQKCLIFLNEIDRLFGKPVKTHSEAVRIGSFEVFTSFFLGLLIRDFLNDLEVEVRELTPGRLEEALLLDQVDIGITYEPLPRPGVEYIKISKIEMGAFARQDVFLKQEILEIPFVVPAKPIEGTPSGVKGQDGWPDEERFRRKTPYRVDVMNTALELVHQGLAAIFIPKFISKLHNEIARSEHRLRELPLPKKFEPVYRDVYIVKRESTPEKHFTRQIAKALRKVCC